MEFHAFQPRAGVRPSPLFKARAAGTSKESMRAHSRVLRTPVYVAIGELARGERTEQNYSSEQVDTQKHSIRMIAKIFSPAAVVASLRRPALRTAPRQQL